MRPVIVAFRFVVLLALVVGISLPVLSQSNTGRIFGTVTDQTGAAINGAAVVVTDVERGITRSLKTDEAGAYVAPNLLSGTYKVRAEAKGFKSVERINIVMEVAKDVVVDMQLQPGEVKETVVVTAEVPLLDTASSTLGGTLSNVEINDLPLSGRNYENLLQLRPGVMRYPGGGFSTTSTNGLRAEDNAYVIEGLYNSEPFSGQGIINGAGIAGDSATILPIDAHSRIQPAGKSFRGVRVEAGRDRERRFEVGYECAAWNCVCVWARGRDGCAELFQLHRPAVCVFTESEPEEREVARTVRWFVGRRDRKRQSLLLWRIRRTTLRRRQSIWRCNESVDGDDGSAHANMSVWRLHEHPRLCRQHPRRDRRFAGAECTDQRGQSASRGLHSFGRNCELQRERIPDQQQSDHQYRERIPQRSHG